MMLTDGHIKLGEQISAEQLLFAEIWLTQLCELRTLELLRQGVQSMSLKTLEPNCGDVMIEIPRLLYCSCGIPVIFLTHGATVSWCVPHTQ